MYIVVIASRANPQPSLRCISASAISSDSVPGGVPTLPLPCRDRPNAASRHPAFYGERNRYAVSIRLTSSSVAIMATAGRFQRFVTTISRSSVTRLIRIACSARAWLQVISMHMSGFHHTADRHATKSQPFRVMAFPEPRSELPPITSLRLSGWVARPDIPTASAGNG